MDTARVSNITRADARTPAPETTSTSTGAGPTNATPVQQWPSPGPIGTISGCACGCVDAVAGATPPTPPPGATDARVENERRLAAALKGKTPAEQAQIRKFVSLSPAEQAKAVKYFQAVEANNQRWFASLSPEQQANATKFFALSEADRAKAIRFFELSAANERRAAERAAAERAAAAPRSTARGSFTAVGANGRGAHGGGEPRDAAPRVPATHRGDDRTPPGDPGAERRGLLTARITQLQQEEAAQRAALGDFNPETGGGAAAGLRIRRIADIQNEIRQRYIEVSQT